MSWARGLRVAVGDLGATDALALGIGCHPDRFDVVVAGLADDETLVDRAFLLSRHQPESFEGSVAIGPGRDGDSATVNVALDRVPSSVHIIRVALIGGVTASADSLREASLRVLVDGSQTQRWEFSGAELSGERAIIVADLYRRNGWRLVLHGTGYRAGLPAFLERIKGGTRLPGAPESPPPTASPPPPTPAGPAPPPAPAGPAPGTWPPPVPTVPRPIAPTPAPAPAPRGAPPVAPGRPAPVAAGGAPPRPGAANRPRTLRTGLTLRERLFSVPVAKALMSPSGVGLLAGGAVAGGVGAGVAVGAGSIAAGAAVLGGAAWLGRGLVAMPGKRGEKVDPFALREPWRHFVRDAVAAHGTFEQLVGRTPPGPLHDRLAEIGGRLEDGIEECWRIASRGDAMSETRVAIDDGAVRAELAALHAQPGAHDPQSRARLAEALQSQIDAADRLDRTIDATYDQLRLIDARIDNAVARALEISATASDSASFGRLGAEVDDLVGDLEALRQGLEEVRAVDPGTPATG